MNESTAFFILSEELRAQKIILMQSVADYVATIKKNVLPELWYLCGIGDGLLIVAGIEYSYTGTEGDSVLMLMEFEKSIPAHQSAYLSEGAARLEEIKSITPHKKSPHPMTAKA